MSVFTAETGCQPELKVSIFDSYDPWIEAQNLLRSELSAAERAYYLDESVLSFLEEFAAEIRYKPLRGILKTDGRMMIQNFDMNQAFQNATNIAGYGSREWHEQMGLERIEDLAQSGSRSVLWLSPPKDANYGFGFRFTFGDFNPDLDGIPFQEELIRYEESLENLDTSQSHLRWIQEQYSPGSTKKPSSATEFLLHPIATNRDTSEFLGRLGIDEQSINRSSRMRDQIWPILQPMMREYQMIMNQMIASQGDYEQLELLNERAKLMIGAMFNKAKLLLQEPQHQEVSQYFDDERQKHDYYHALYSCMPLLTLNGTSCPVAQSGSSMFVGIAQQYPNSPFSALNVYGQLQMSEVKDRKKSLKCTCPFCNKKVEATIAKGKISCPKCEKSAPYKC